MTDATKDDLARRQPADADRAQRDKEQRAAQPGGNPDAPPSADAGNVGLGAADDGEAPRKPGGAI